MLTRTVPIALGKSEVNHVDFVALAFAMTDQEIVRLYITVQDSCFVDLLNVLHELYCNHEDCFKVHLFLARLE